MNMPTRTRRTPSVRLRALAVVVAPMLAGSALVAGTARADDAPSSPAPAAPASSPAPAAGPKQAPAPAAASSPGTPTAANLDHLALGRAAKDKNDWNLAISEFTLAVKADPKSADANNLLGYSYRKSGNLTMAFQYYGTALKLDPKHLGALEYQGEAFVQSGQIAKAKANLASLSKLCGKSCEQYKDLSAFIASASKKTAGKTK